MAGEKLNMFGEPDLFGDEKGIENFAQHGLSSVGAESGSPSDTGGESSGTNNNQRGTGNKVYADMDMQELRSIRNFDDSLPRYPYGS